MKYFILFMLCISASVLDAQTTFIKKNPNGTLDTVWHVKGRDTFLIESYRPNGTLAKHSWHHDSAYFFDNQNIIIDKQYYFKEKVNQAVFEPSDATLREMAYYKRRQQFYPNGNIKQFTYWSGDTLLRSLSYAVNGTVLEDVQYRQRNRSVFEWATQTLRNKDVTLYDTVRLSKQNWLYDKSGRLEVYTQYHLWNTEIDNYAFGYPLAHRIEYDSTGQKKFEWKLDSNQLKPFKNNGLCLYGFLNLKGDTIISAQYEGVQEINEENYNPYFIVHTATHYSILDAFGNAIIPSKWSFLSKLKGCYYGETELEQTYLRCRTNTGFGVIRLNGQILLQPVYQDVRYSNRDLFEVKIGNSWGIVDKTGTILVEPKYPTIAITGDPNLYLVTSAHHSKINSTQINSGLIRKNGDFVLPAEFSEIKPVYNGYFTVKVPLKHSESTNYDKYYGIFHPEKGWIFDTSHQLEHGHSNYFTLKNERTNSSAVIDSRTMQFILPFEYQSLKAEHHERFDPSELEGKRIFFFYIAKKNNKLGIFDPENQQWILPLEYDFLQTWGYSDTLLLTLKKGVWAIRNFKGQIVGNQSFTNFGDSYVGYFGQRGDSVVFLSRSTFPFTTPMLKSAAMESGSLMQLKTTDHKQLIINNLQKVVVATGQQIVLFNGNDVLVRDSVRNLQLLIDSTGKTTVFLPQFKIVELGVAKNVIIVFDSVRRKLGTVRRDGSFILPNDFFAIHALDLHGVLWAKKDASPALSGKQSPNKEESWGQIFQDTIHRLDKGWAMYDKNGQLLTNTLFEYAFEWHDSIGIGQVNGKQGLWHVSGKNVVSPNYDKIWYDNLNQIFHLFEVQNNDNQSVGFANARGQLIADGVFKNMSSFHGAYAFVETDKGLGIISKTGKYLVEPNVHSIQQSVLNLMPIMTHFEDSLRLNRQYGEYLFDTPFNEPYKKVFNTLSIDNQLKASNLFIEYYASNYFLRPNRMIYDRSDFPIFCATEPMNQFIRHVYANRFISLKAEIYDFKIANQYLNFWVDEINLSDYIGCGNRDPNFQSLNFKWDKDHWKQIKLGNLLDINEKNESIFIQLFSQKLSALKNVEIDCSNPSKYIEMVVNQFYVLDSGIQFKLPHQYENKDLSIFFTWAELNPFLF